MAKVKRARAKARAKKAVSFDLRTPLYAVAGAYKRIAAAFK